MSWVIPFCLVVALFAACDGDRASDVTLQALQNLQGMTPEELQQLILDNIDHPPPSRPIADDDPSIVQERPASHDNLNTVSDTVAAALSDPGCAPRLTMHSVASSGTWINFPNCVGINRCDGDSCCGHEGLSCQPTQKRDITKTIVRGFVDPSTGQTTTWEQMEMRFEEHLECECGCKIKEEHCHPARHTYLQDDCRCECKNYHDRLRCDTSYEIWSDELCECICRETYECPPNYYFDHTTCGCSSGSPVIPGDEQDQDVDVAEDVCAGVSCRAPTVPMPPDCTCVHSDEWGTGGGGGVIGERPASGAKPATPPRASNTTPAPAVRPRPRPRPRPRW